MASVYSRLLIEILENLMNGYDNLCFITDGNDGGTLVSNEKESQTDFRGFSSKQEDQRLNRRLQILEDDAEVIKQAFFSSLEERKVLIQEIYELFQMIHHFLSLQSQGKGEKTRAGALIINPHKNRRMGTGLSQVLIQDSNPALVTRGLRAADLLVFQESAESEEAAFIPRDYFFS